MLAVEVAVPFLIEFLGLSYKAANPNCKGLRKSEQILNVYAVPGTLRDPRFRRSIKKIKLCIAV